MPAILLLLYCTFVSEPTYTPIPSGARSSAVAPASLKRHLVAAALSTVIPGAGQLFLGRRRKAIVLLAIFLATAIGFWPLRLPRSLPGLILLLWVCLLLSLFSVCDALLSRDENSRLSKWWLLAGIPLIYLGMNIIFTSLLLSSGFRALRFTSTAMEPTLSPGDKFIYDVHYYRQHPCERDDLGVMLIEGVPTVKRVIAVAGDTIEGKNQQILLNGHLLDEPFAQHPRGGGNDPRQDTFGPVTVSVGKYFVIGDNRDTSRDSRMSEFGQADRDAIVGRPLYIYRLPWEEPHWERLH